MKSVYKRLIVFAVINLAKKIRCSILYQLDFPKHYWLLPSSYPAKAWKKYNQTTPDHYRSWCSQLPEMAKTTNCRHCFESLKSTEGLKSVLQKPGLNSDIACRSLQEKENPPQVLSLHQHCSCFYLGLAICHLGVAIKMQPSHMNGLIYSSY